MTAEFLSRLPEMEREAAEYERRARALRQIIAGVRALNGHAAEVPHPVLVRQNDTIFVAQPLDKNGPRAREAVIRIMEEAPTHEWKVIELKREMLRRGWAPSPKAVEATISRMREAGELESTRYGYYKLALHLRPFVPGFGTEEADE